jgi:hypothetical protein
MQGLYRTEGTKLRVMKTGGYSLGSNDHQVQLFRLWKVVEGLERNAGLEKTTDDCAYLERANHIRSDDGYLV